MRGDFVRQAPDLVFERPGSTAEEIARLALERGCHSQADDPVGSLAGTLAKLVREDRLPGVESYGSDPVRYFPCSSNVGTRVRVSIDLVCRNGASGLTLSGTASGEGVDIRKALLSTIADALRRRPVPDVYIEGFFGLREVEDVLTSSAVQAER